MKLAAMQYKTYIWPHNPRTYTIRYERNMAVHKVPFGRYVLQDLGLTRRVMRGEGEFYGPGAYNEFKKLASVFYQSGPGILMHPVWQSSSAYFVELELTQEPRENYVRYTFAFWEAYDGYAQQLKAVAAPAAAFSGTVSAPTAAAQYYTAVHGDTLWGISRRYGLTLSQLLELNPQIKNPNILHVGDWIRVR